MKLPPLNGTLLTTAVWAVLAIQALTWAGVLDAPTLRRQQDAARLAIIDQRAIDQSTTMALQEQRLIVLERTISKLEGQIEQMVMLLHALDVRTARLPVGAGDGAGDNDNAGGAP